MLVIGLNGPPRVGKDAVASVMAKILIQRDVPARVVSVVEPLARQGALLLGVEYSDEWYIKAKATPQALFNGETLRQWMIGQVEVFYKPRYGADFFTRALIQQVQVTGFDGVLIVTNIGFQYEAYRFEEAYQSENVAIVQVARGELSFEGDSRGPVTGTHTFHIFNKENGIDECARRILYMMGRRMGWYLGR